MENQRLRDFEKSETERLGDLEIPTGSSLSVSLSLHLYGLSGGDGCFGAWIIGVACDGDPGIGVPAARVGIPDGQYHDDHEYHRGNQSSPTYPTIVNRGGFGFAHVAPVSHPTLGR